MEVEDAEIPSSSDSEEEALSTNESECEVTSSSLSEGEEGGCDEDSDKEEKPMSLAIESRVQVLIAADSCKQRRMSGKAEAVERLVSAVDAMTSAEKKTHIITALAVSMEAGAPERSRSTGQRQRFAYFLPFVGAVCRGAFCQCYGVGPATVSRYKTQLDDGILGVKPHGGRLNLNVAVLDLDWIVTWVKELASQLGEMVPVRVRRQRLKDGKVSKVLTTDRFTMLPAFFTWEKLHEQLTLAIAEAELDAEVPSLSSFRSIAAKHCRTLCIQSPRSNVCDTCTIYKFSLRGVPSAASTELFGKHTEAARILRLEYKKDVAECSDAAIVITMDFAQNLTLPSVVATPSDWYFMSLIWVHVFGVAIAHTNTQYNFVYNEREAGKRTNEINSMLAYMLDEVLLPLKPKKLTVYADNCKGQNINNFVLDFLLLVVQLGWIDEVNYKFFVKGHTKNACDRGFGQMKRHVQRQDRWTMDQLTKAVEKSSSANQCIRVLNDSAFRNYTFVVDDMYKKVKSIQKYQLFRMRRETPGVVECRVLPEAESVLHDLRRVYDRGQVDEDHAKRLLPVYLETLPRPTINAGKATQIYKSIRQYVPAEFQSDSPYAATSPEQEEEAKAIKKARRERKKHDPNSNKQDDTDKSSDKMKWYLT